MEGGPVICTLGDLLLDVVVRLDGPIAEDTDTYGRSRVAPGGQAANVAAAQKAFHHRAHMNALAAQGKWKNELERQAA